MHCLVLFFSVLVSCLSLRLIAKDLLFLKYRYRLRNRSMERNGLFASHVFGLLTVGSILEHGY